MVNNMELVQCMIKVGSRNKGYGVLAKWLDSLIDCL
jgi:hypothetical protein